MQLALLLLGIAALTIISYFIVCDRKQEPSRIKIRIESDEEPRKR